MFLSLSVSIFDFPLAVHSFAVFILPSKMLGRMERDGRGSISITEGEEITGTEIKSEIEERERERDDERTPYKSNRFYAT